MCVRAARVVLRTACLVPLTPFVYTHSRVHELYLTTYISLVGTTWPPCTEMRMRRQRIKNYIYSD